MSDIKELIKKRGTIKAKLTQFGNYLENVISVNIPLTEVQLSELESRLNKIDLLYSSYDALQSEIELLSENPDEMYQEREQWESLYYSKVSVARTKLAAARETSYQNLENRSEYGSLKSGHGRGRDFVRLPKIDLPHFDGDYQHWLEFRDTYISLIHDNTDIQNINKFHYLRAALKGSASLVIHTLDFTSTNYTIAWQLLLKRYDNKRLLVNNYIQVLFNLEPIHKESCTALRNLVYLTLKNLRALATLGEPTESWDTLIIFMMAKKLDTVTNREWEEHRNTLSETPTLDQFTNFLNNKCDLLETLQNDKQYLKSCPPINHKYTYHANETIPHKTKTLPTNTETQSNANIKTTSCPMCSQNHYLFACQLFRGLDIDSRIKKASQSNVCINCLRPGHTENRCNLTHCKYCPGKHSTLLHKEVHVEPETDNCIALSTEVVHTDCDRTHVLLSTALVRVADAQGNMHTARLLLDNGSSANFVTQSLSDKLGLVKRSAGSTVSGINSQNTNAAESCDLSIESCFSAYKTKLSCYVLPKITNMLPVSYLDKRHILIPEGLRLADPNFNVPANIDILVGAEVFWEVLRPNFINLGRNKPNLHETKLGWLISGNIIHPSVKKQNTCNFVHTLNDDQHLTRFWELDTVSTNHCMSKEELVCEQYFKDTTRRDKNGQFVVTIPLKNSPETLGDSYGMAKSRFLSTERRLNRDATLKQKYNTFIKEYIDMGHMTENKHSHKNNKINVYLPHHHVLRESSSTTKLRVVFDGSAATTSGKAFNDIQMVGPTIQDDLLSILLRFRQHRFVISGDIEKMYRAILVEPSQRPLQQIIHRFNSSDPLRTYSLNTVTYGTASAPYLATKCLVSLADQAPNAEVKRAISRDFYVDDLLSGGNCIKSVTQLCKEIADLLKTANFNLRKWQSNSLEILASVRNIGSNSEKPLNLNDYSPSKTLGLYWDSLPDTLLFSIKINVGHKITKRIILSLVGQIFDPMGLVGPCIVEAKCILQKLWINRCDWDDEVSSDLKSEFLDFIHSLPSLNTLHIPRWVFCDQYELAELHVFTDASERAYGACVYVRTVGTDGSICVRLIASKNKISPKNPTTIPRLELCGALLGTRLCSKVLSSLTVSFNQVYYWSDSTIVLGWLRKSPSQLKQFVGNRVGEIQDTTQVEMWSYVPSKENPADLVSRGVKADAICTSKLWWTGPTFLHHKEIKFPTNLNLHSTDLPEISLHNLTNTTNENLILKQIHKSSNYKKIFRTIAYVSRFIHNCKNKQSKTTNHLTLSELQSSQNLIIKLSQLQMFPEEHIILKTDKTLHSKNRLISLTPFIDSNGIIRVGGRLHNSNYCYDVKHPILLCAKHHITKIIFEYYHNKTLVHAGPQLLLANIRLTFWVLGGRNLSKKVVHACVRCTRYKAKTVQPIMGNLPSDRTHLEFPFLNTGLDYAGPVLTVDRKGRGSRLQKSYICVFVCFAVKAVHLELVSDLTKEAFLAAFSRFTSRRGKPQKVFSDNGSSFVGGFNELNSFLNSVSNDIKSEVANLGIDINFIPAYTPHFGGLWESAVKQVKHHLRRILSLTHLTFEELTTCLVQIEAILNSRPLIPLSADPSDLSYLSPSHFLIGRSLTSVPCPQLMDVNINRLQRFRRIEKLKQHFWERFSNEYVSLLQQKVKWHSSTGHLNLGDMVLVKEANRPPLLWLLGRVTAVHPGSDGVVRVADILTKKGCMTRAYTNLCPLPKKP